MNATGNIFSADGHIFPKSTHTHVVIYKTFCSDVAQGHVNWAPNETLRLLKYEIIYPN